MLSFIESHSGDKTVAECIKDLQAQNPAIYGRLSHSTILGWSRCNNKKQQKKLAKQSEKERKSRGRPTLKKTRDQVEETLKATHNNRVAATVLIELFDILEQCVEDGVPFNGPFVHALMLTLFEERGVDWTPSLSYVYTFLKRCGLRWRRATKAKGKLPSDFERIKDEFLARFVLMVDKFGLDPQFVFNLDETGMHLMPMPTSTFAPGGSVAVQVLGFRDKRQFTMIPILSADGRVVPLAQIIWEGKSVRCEPAADVKALFPAILHGHTVSHWSSPETKEELIDALYDRHVRPMMERAIADGEPKPYWLVVLDVHSSNRNAAMLKRLKAKYPTLLLLFVPPNCTSMLQPTDLELNGPIKFQMQCLARQWISAQIAARRQQGNGDVRLDLSKAALELPYCSWVNDVLRWASGKPEMLNAAWRPFLFAWESDAVSQAARKRLVKLGVDMVARGELDASLLDFSPPKGPHEPELTDLLLICAGHVRLVHAGREAEEDEAAKADDSGASLLATKLLKKKDVRKTVGRINSHAEK